MSQATPSLLFGSWLHSHEEDTATATVYRRADYDFPPARGRRGFDLRADGTLTETGIGPTDRSVHTKGHWRLTDNKCLEFSRAPASPPTRVLEIESADGNRLVVKKSAQTCAVPDSGPAG